MTEACRGDVARPHAGEPRGAREQPSAGGAGGGAAAARPGGVLGHWPAIGARGGPPSRRRRRASRLWCVKPSSQVRQPEQSEPAGASCRRTGSGVRGAAGVTEAAAGTPPGGGGGERRTAGGSRAATATEGRDEGEPTRPPIGGEVAGGPGGERRAAGSDACGEVPTEGREGRCPGRGGPAEGGAPMGGPERRACVL
jgi:hypothetical protein